MAQLFDIKKVVVGPRKLTATVVVAASAPLRTVEDLEATTRIWQLMPQLRDHVCLGDSSQSFGDVMGDTEIAHLLEHVTVELLARTNIAGDITSGQTAEVGERTYEISLTCTDDVLVTGALSSAVWIMQWAFAGGGEPSPDVDAIAGGLVELVASLPDTAEADQAAEAAAQDEPPFDGETDEDDEPKADAEPPADEPAGEDLLAAEAAPIYEFNPQQVEEAAAEEAPAPAEPAPAPAGAIEAAPAYVAPCDYAPDPAANFVNEPAPVAAADPAPAQEPQTSTFGDWGMENVPRPRPVR